MHKLAKLGLIAFTAAQLTSCDDKGHSGEGETYLEDEYFLFDTSHQKAKRVEIYKNNSLDTKTKIEFPALEIKPQNTRGPVTDASHPNVYGEVLEVPTKSLTTTYVSEYKEWNENRDTVIKNDTVKTNIYRKQLVRTLKAFDQK